MRQRIVGPIAIAILAVAVVALPVRPADTTHRDGFPRGGELGWIKGDGNIEFAEKVHQLSTEHARNDETSEYIKIEANPAPGAIKAEFAHYYYRTPVAPVTKDLLAGVYVKAYKTGIQLKARVVFPKEKDPANPNLPLTTLIAGETYADARMWKQLKIDDAPTVLRNQMAALTAKVGRAVDDTGAYIDCLVLNVYTGPGASEVWIDDLAIGPVTPGTQPKADPKAAAAAAKKKHPIITFSNGDILIDPLDEKGERPYFFRAIRHGDVPLGILEQARFNTIWFPDAATKEAYEEAVRAKFFLVPSLPLLPDDADEKTAPEKDAEAAAKFLKTFPATDAVLMWNLGSGRTTDQVRRVASLADAMKRLDPRRPRAVELWDGYGAYSSYADAIGGHRWPLFSSLEMGNYRDWLQQRRALTGPGKLSWTHVQTHLPDWYQNLVHGKANVENFPDPIGPHPEQIRILTYLAVATGHRGLLYWSDKFLAESCHGQDRLLEIALLNAELELLEPILLNAADGTQWLTTSDANVNAAVMRSAKEIVVLPIYFGSGTQHCPDQCVRPSLTIKVPLIPEGATAWRVRASGLEEIKGLKRTSDGTELVLSEFDTAEPILITTDVSCTGRIVKMQEQTKNRFGRWAAYIARRQAWVQYQKTAETHKLILAAGGPEVKDALTYFARSKCLIEEASKSTDSGLHELAYLASRRALRPLRLVLHEHWRHAVEQLDVPTASPYAISAYALPKHWELHRYIASTRPGGNAATNGTFDLADKAGDDGAAIASLPGYVRRSQFLDPVTGFVSIVDVESPGVKDPPILCPDPKFERYESTGRPIPSEASKKLCAPKPTLGSHVLKLEIQPKKGTEAPKALERSYVAVTGPMAALPPGSWCRISFWAKVPGTASTADGAMVYDSVGEEPLAVRIGVQKEWKHYHLYRPVPETGKIGVTFALTGLGTAYFDDLRIEPMLPSATPVSVSQRLPLLADRAVLPKPLPLKEDKRELPKPRPLDKEKEKEKGGPSEVLPTPRPAGREPALLPLPEIAPLPPTTPISVPRR